MFIFLWYRSGGKYGFSDRVIDGMTVVVNSVVINFSSPAFQASFQVILFLFLCIIILLVDFYVDIRYSVRIFNDKGY